MWRNSWLFPLVVSLLLIVFLSSCFTIEKRLYRDGFYISCHSKNHSKENYMEVFRPEKDTRVFSSLIDSAIAGSDKTESGSGDDIGIPNSEKLVQTEALDFCEDTLNKEEQKEGALASEKDDVKTLYKLPIFSSFFSGLITLLIYSSELIPGVIIAASFFFLVGLILLLAFHEHKGIREGKKIPDWVFIAIASAILALSLSSILPYGIFGIFFVFSTIVASVISIIKIDAHPDKYYGKAWPIVLLSLIGILVLLFLLFFLLVLIFLL